MNLRTTACLLTSLLALTLPQAQAVVFNITESTSGSLFTPTFRDTTGGNANNTTWFGWGAGDFAGNIHLSNAYRVLDGANPTIGANSLKGSLSQLNGYNILASSNNIYPTTSKFPAGVTSETININIPINVSLENVGTGYTTIIIQGNTISSPYGSNPPQFLALDYPGEVQMTYVVGTNQSSALNGAIGRGQFWVKYEIEGSALDFTVSFLAGLNGNIAGITVDTMWSPTQFAADTAIAPVPEPSTVLLAGIGLALLVWKTRRRTGPATHQA